MELYDHTTTGIFPLSSLKEETSRGIGSTGTNNASRATLGLKALYAGVGSTAGLKRARAPSPPIHGDDGHGNSSDNASLRNGVVPEEGRGGSRKGAADEPIEKRGGGVCGGDGCGGGGGSGGEREGARLLTTPTTAPPSPDGLSLVTMPLLGHRYRCVSTIGTGAFSDVFRAEDTFRPGRLVAIKVMKLGCRAIGIREVRYMQFLGSVPKSEFSPVVRLLDAFVFRGHQCLVMELFDDTLLPYTLRPAGGGGLENGAASATVGYGGLDFLAGSRLLDQRMGADRHVFRRLPGVAEGGRASSEREQAWGRGVGGPPSPSPPLSYARGGGGAGSSGGGSGESSGGCPTHIVRHVALQLLSALHLLHSNGVIHADVKPQNVLLGTEAEEAVGGGGGGGGGGGDPALRVEEFMRGRAGRGCGGRECSPPRVTVKLCDFGSAIHKSEACLYYSDFEIQTLAYRAPEVLMGCPFGPPIDTWSTGVILLELLLGRPLFHTAGSRAALLAQIVCAFGPLPLRRFRVGRFYSEYFAHDQSMKVGASSTGPRDDDVPMGCCSCCWVEDTSPGSAGGHPRHGVSRCRGSCAERCRAPDQRRQSSGGGSTQANGGRRVPTFFAAAGRQSAAFSGSAGTRSGASLECPRWGIAHARLFRLVTAADGVPLMDQGAPLASGPASGPGPSLAPGTASKPENISGGSSGGGGGVVRPRACRSRSGDSSTARRNPRLLSLLAGLLSLDPDERLTPLQALAHPFFDEVVPFVLPTATGERNVKVKPEPTQAAPALSESPCAVSATGPVEGMMSRRGCEKQASPLGNTFWGNALEGTPALSQSMAAAATAATTTTAAAVTRISDISESSGDSVNGGVDAEPRPHERGAAPTPGGGLNRGRDEGTRAPLGVFTSRTRSAVQSRPETACRIGKPTAPSSAAWVSELGELDPTAQLRRLAETAEEMVGKGIRSTSCGLGYGGSSTSSGNGSGISSGSGSGSGSSSSSGGSGDSGCGGGGGSGIGICFAGVTLPPPPPTPRRKRFMDVLPRTTPDLAGAQDEAKPAPNLSTLFRTSTEQQQQQLNLVSRAPPAATRAPGHGSGATAHEGGAATIAGRRRRNRFLSPATLAKLDHDKTKRIARAAGAGMTAGAGVGALPAPAAAVAAAAPAAAANCWAARTKPESMPAKKRPPKRPLLEASPGGDHPGTASKKAKAAAAVVVVALAPAATRELLPEENPLLEPHRAAPGTEEDTTPSKTPGEAGGHSVRAAGDRAGRAIFSRRAAGTGRTMPPRRAAMAAGVALSRLRQEDSDSDSSSTL